MLIANPNATTLTPRVQRHIVQTLLRVPNLHLRAQFTHYPKHAGQMVRGLTRADYDILIIVGGDGTVNEVLNGLLGPAGNQHSAAELPRLFFVPTGSANVFARALGFPQDPIDAVKLGAALIENAVTQTVDLGTWGSHWFAANAGIGIDADVIASMEKVRDRGARATPVRYFLFGLNSWRRVRQQPPHISFAATDRHGREVSCEGLPLFFVANTNPWTFFGPVPVVTNPSNSLTRGLGVYALRSLRGLTGVLAMANLVGLGQSPEAQRRVARRRIRVDNVARIEVRCQTPLKFQVDGEYVAPVTAMEFGAVPEAIEVYAPPKPQGRDAVSSLKALRNFIPVGRLKD